MAWNRWWLGPWKMNRLSTSPCQRKDLADGKASNSWCWPLSEDDTFFGTLSHKSDISSHHIYLFYLYFQATFLSKQQPNCGSFSVNQDGRATCLQDLSADRMRGRNNFEIDYVEVPSESRDLSRSSSTIESRALNPTGYMWLHIYLYPQKD